MKELAPPPMPFEITPLNVVLPLPMTPKLRPVVPTSRMCTSPLKTVPLGLVLLLKTGTAPA